MENKLISIIVPVYKVEGYLEKCIDSILNQTYKNLQIILINDGSPDSCGKICNKYTEKDNRITVIHKENGGLSEARNFGIEIAEGEYISFIDSDDYIDATMISRMYAVLKEENVNLVQCDFKVVRDENIYKKSEITKPFILDRETMFDTRKTKITAWGKLYFTDIVKKIMFKENKINEDEFFTYKALYESSKIAVIQEPLYFYYQSPNSIMRNSNHFIKPDFMEAYDERIKYFNDKGSQKLSEISKKEYSIRLMLAYIKTFNNKHSKNDISIFLNAFKENYRQIKHIKYFDKKEILILKFFNFSPKIISKLWGLFK